MAGSLRARLPGRLEFFNGLDGNFLRIGFDSVGSFKIPETSTPAVRPKNVFLSGGLRLSFRDFIFLV